MQYNTRFAPSPTGPYIHIGNIRTAYFNWLAARSTQSNFTLRIDDTDQNRHQEDAVKVIYDSMEWLGLDYDVTFRQSDHKDLYNQCVEELLSNDLVYEDEGAIRLRTPDLPDNWHDEIAGDVKISIKDKESIDGLVLIKSDGNPTYHFSTVVDDAFSNINYIIRGNDHTSNTCKHIAIYLQMQKCNGGFDFSIPKYAHVGLIHKNKKKMSKRDPDNSSSLLYYKDAGYSPDAILNFLLRLGWSHSDANYDSKFPLVDKEKALTIFLNEGRMRSAPANFDQAKLDWLDKKYKNLTEGD